MALAGHLIPSFIALTQRLAQCPVAVRSGSIMAATFHPELTDDDRLHGQFLAGIANTSGE